MTLDYKILLTPLVRKDIYGTTVDVTQNIDISDLISRGGISEIRKEIDQGDYEIGIFNYGSITLTCYNKDGKFNDRNIDPRSIFPWRRDQAIIEIFFIDQLDVETSIFKGLIADRGTRQDIIEGSFILQVLGLDSIFEQNQVLGGAVQNGDDFKKAFEVILNIPSITKLLNYNSVNINPTLNLIIDVGSNFNKLITKAALDDLLIASNSILLIDESDNIIVRSRVENSNTPHNFYSNDQHKRDNIRRLFAYNNGLQRMFNSVLINQTEAKNQISIDEYNIRQISFNLSFITIESKEQIIAQSILSTFGLPQTEFELTTDSNTAKDIKILDKVTVSVEFVTKPIDNYDVAIYDIDVYNTSKYGHQIGSLAIDGRKIFKVIAFSEDTTTFRTTMKLRDTGKLL